MRRMFSLLAVVFMTAFFVFGPVQAEDAKSCPDVDQESILTKGIEESPDLLVTILEGEKLQHFWAAMRKKAFMVGNVDVDKVYVFRSESHPEMVYVFFLNNGCIQDVKPTFKSLIEGLIK